MNITLGYKGTTTTIFASTKIRLEMIFKMMTYVNKATHMTSCSGTISFQGVVIVDCVPLMKSFFTWYNNWSIAGNFYSYVTSKIWGPLHEWLTRKWTLCLGWQVPTNVVFPCRWFRRTQIKKFSGEDAWNHLDWYFWRWW